MASFRKNFKPTIDEKMKTFLTLYDYIKENKTSCIDCENLEVKNVKKFETTKYSSVCKISGECVLYPKYCNNYKFSDKTKRNIINCWIDILCKEKEKEHMKKISLEELKDKDLYLDDDEKIIVREKQKGKFLPKFSEKYYYVSDDLSVWQTNNYGAFFDLLIINKDYAFRTKEEAEEYAKYLKALEKYRYKFTNDELKNPYTPKYQLYFIEDKIEYIGYGTVNCKIWFKSSNDCDLFIREVGIDNIKKFMFDIWE